MLFEGMVELVYIVISFLAVTIIPLIIWIFKTLSNKRHPIIECAAKVVSKRINIVNRDPIDGDYAETLYYATFEFEDGKRKEFKVKGKLYGILVEGDKGTLKFQGSKYIGFKK